LRTNIKKGVNHIFYFEDNNLFFRRWKQKAPKNLIVTIHQPPERYDSGRIESLKKISSAIVLYKKDVTFFEKYVGKGRVKFIHHGVESNFFRPSSKNKKVKIKLLFAGQNGRNTKMLFRVIKILSKEYPEMEFSLLVPKKQREVEGLRELQEHPKVQWLEGLSDRGLLRLYQSSYLLLLPLNIAGANNAIVESLACGLPVVTTDVGGVRDYGGGSIYPIVKNNDDKAMIKIIKRYIHDKRYYYRISNACRKFAKKDLSWELAAKKHIEAYKQLIK
jgi:glycosyltransferase involved in cell wall biosynthesis